MRYMGYRRDEQGEGEEGTRKGCGSVRALRRLCKGVECSRVWATTLVVLWRT